MEEMKGEVATVSEIVLKRRKTNEELALRRKEQRKFRLNKNKQEFIKKPEDFVKEFRYRDEAMIEKLQKIEPYVTYGFPSLKTVKDLIYKKGFAKINKQRVPLTDNNLIEEALAKYNIICLEDIVHEIASTGKYFKEAASFLWPFTLNKPDGGLKGVKARYLDGGDTGIRQDKINELISKMN